MSEHVYKIVGAPSMKITALRTKYNHLKNNKFRWQKHEDK